MFDDAGRCRRRKKHARAVRNRVNRVIQVVEVRNGQLGVLLVVTRLCVQTTAATTDAASALSSTAHARVQAHCFVSNLRGKFSDRVEF